MYEQGECEFDFYGHWNKVRKVLDSLNVNYHFVNKEILSHIEVHVTLFDLAQKAEVAFVLGKMGYNVGWKAKQIENSWCVVVTTK